MWGLIASVVFVCLAYAGFLTVHRKLNVGEFKLCMMYTALLVTNRRGKFILLLTIRAYARCRKWSLHILTLNNEERELLSQLREANRKLAR